MIKPSILLAMALLTLSGCSDLSRRQQWALAGGVLGAAGGAAWAASGHSFTPGAGAEIGGATGAAVGAVVR